MKLIALSCVFFISGINSLKTEYKSEYIKKAEYIYSEYDIIDNQLPQSWDWGNINGINYLTKSLNQHIPQYCGSCWAHGALSALGDRIKIARNTSEPDINLAVQFLLNCGDAGTCEGGDHLAAYKFIKNYGGIPFDTCLVYEACSSDSPAAACGNRDFSCKAINICRTCFNTNSDGCRAIKQYPNATISSYGALNGYLNMQHEIYKSGPIACGVNAVAILNYTGGVLDVPNEDKNIDHVISIVGWGYNEKIKKQYWIVRNSWGEYWGELGFFRVVLGDNQLGLERSCAWAKPNSWTEHNNPCDEDGANCQKNM